MSLFKRMMDKKKSGVFHNALGQNLIEFIFVFPILIFMTLVIFEVALFWQDVNSIYNLNAEINANAALLDYSNLSLGNVCPAADDTPAQPKSAINILKAKASIISLTNPTFTKSIALDTDGTLMGSDPFALYKFTAGHVAGQTSPQITLWVDCRNPFENGVTTQLEFYHKTLIIKATIPRFDSRPKDVDPKDWDITIIPDTVFIASPKLNTIRHY